MTHVSLRDEYLALIRRNGLEDYMRRRDAVKVDPRIALDAVEEGLVASGIDPSRAKSIIKRVETDLKPERGYDPLIEEMDTRIIAALEEMGIPISVPILAASYPHGSLNAQACMTPAGVLLLLNDGALAALDQTAKIFSHFIRFTPFGDSGPARDATGAVKAEPDPGAREYSEGETFGGSR